MSTYLMLFVVGILLFIIAVSASRYIFKRFDWDGGECFLIAPLVIMGLFGVLQCIFCYIKWLEYLLK